MSMRNTSSITWYVTYLSLIPSRTSVNTLRNLITCYDWLRGVLCSDCGLPHVSCHTTTAAKQKGTLLASNYHIQTCHISRLLWIQGYKQVLSTCVSYYNHPTPWPIPRYTITSYVSFILRQEIIRNTNISYFRITCSSTQACVHHFTSDKSPWWNGKGWLLSLYFPVSEIPQSCGVSGGQVDKVSTWL